MQDSELVDSANRTLELEASAIQALSAKLDHNFIQACRLVLACQARVVVIGMGKSGHIGRKVAATLASTGSPAFFVHPAEASHGDIGMLTKEDVVLALSNSGSTAEVIELLPLVKALGVKLIAMTGDPKSPLALAADAHLDVSVEREACPLDLAPTSSTTATLAMGDAFAIALLEARGFTAEDFAFSHPGGALGRRLLIKVQDLMHCDDGLPQVSGNMPLKQALLEMTSKGLGMTTIVDASGKLQGVFTDGDLRRLVDRGEMLDDVTMSTVMNREPLRIAQNRLAAEALGMMEERKVTALVAVDAADQPKGVIHLHDILRAGVI